MADEAPGDPRDAFQALIKTADLEVNHPPGFIFLCGGACNPDLAGAPFSARDAVLRSITDTDADLALRITLAEEVQNWNDDGVYHELITFEHDMAALASVIVVFVESEGAIAELGVFSQLRGVNEKLLVFVQEEHYASARSFIRLGPIKYLETFHPGSVVVYPWTFDGHGTDRRVNTQSIDNCSEEMIEAIREAVDSEHRPRKFSKDDPSHQMLLICDLLNLMIGLKESEIVVWLQRFGVQIELRLLRRFLFVLEQLDFVEKVSRGRNHYYVSKKTEPAIRYGLPPEAFDRSRFKFHIAAYYRKHDRPRHAALSPFLSEQDRGG